MNNSTENVTLFASFINDILKNYEDKKEDYLPLFEFTKAYDLSSPTNLIPIKVYNEMCDWLEINLGKYNLIRVGRNVGETAYGVMLSNNMFSETSKPEEIMKALVQVAQFAIQDPEKRGWEILESSPKHLLVRRTQTFNSQMQLGLLDGIIRKTGVSGVKISFKNEIAQGAAFDDYLITWI